MDWSNRSNYDRERYFKRKEMLLDLVGRKCVKCGTEDKIEFDHIDPSTKLFSLMGAWNRPLEELKSEAIKCQPLCHDCHKEKSINFLAAAHGGGKSGKRNCKCEPCKRRKAEYMREWKRSRRASKAA